MDFKAFTTDVTITLATAPFAVEVVFDVKTCHVMEIVGTLISGGSISKKEITSLALSCGFSSSVAASCRCNTTRGSSSDSFDTAKPIASTNFKGYDF